MLVFYDDPMAERPYIVWVGDLPNDDARCVAAETVARLDQRMVDQGTGPNVGYALVPTDPDYDAAIQRAAGHTASVSVND